MEAKILESFEKHSILSVITIHFYKNRLNLTIYYLFQILKTYVQCRTPCQMGAEVLKNS